MNTVENTGSPELNPIPVPLNTQKATPKKEPGQADAMIQYEGTTIENKVLEPPDSSLPRLPNPAFGPSSQANSQIVQKNLSQWLSPTFSGAFSAIMIEIINSQKENAFLNAQLEVLIRQSVLDFAKSNAEMTKLLYDKQALEQALQAGTSFFSATISAAQMGSLSNNSKMAEEKFAQTSDGVNYTTEKQKLASNQTEFEAKQSAVDTKQKEVDAKKIEVDNKQKAFDAAEKDFKTKNPTANQTEIDANQEVKKAKTELNTAKTDLNTAETELNTATTERDAAKTAYDAQKKVVEPLETKKVEIIGQETRNADMRTQAFFQMKEQIMQSISKAITAGIKGQEGRIDALIKMNDGYNQALQKFQETTGKATDQEKSELDKAAQFWKDILNQLSQGKRIKG